MTVVSSKSIQNEPKLIVTVQTSNETTLYLIGFDPSKNELTFKSSRNPARIQKEIVFIKGDVVYTDFHFFDISYLDKLKPKPK